MSPAPYVLTFGETMALMRADQVGPLAHASTMSLGIGGSESNVAIGLRRLGVQAVWCGRVGADSLGQLVEREIRAEGVDVRIAVDPSAPTGLMIKERRTPDAQRVSYYRAGSAGSRIAPEDIDDRLVSGARLLHVSGITPALSAQAAETFRHAIGVARDAGVLVSFDLNFRGNLWSREGAGNVYRDLIPLMDIVFAGEDEAAIAVGAGEPQELARRIATLGPSQAVIKLGADGALAIADGEMYHQAAIAVSVVDTVGAGDAFVAGYLAELMEGRAPEERLRTAVATGAFACLVPGDWEGFPRRHELVLLEAKEPVSR
ncbi:2-dehydro-3-deoxygluconokinase [Arthrobacter globiformis]|uniref:sugar kinase n=1 Tax=Arthrobacter globiformis TaxID=1665 RepID=UPI0027875F0C|nr:sugar kinase [Arthrobacter globiformis]MDQ1060286.1 2-dehydro-3-deoxygluconokinase [Arthrobacter globiformis]